MCPRTAAVPEAQLCEEVINVAFKRFLQFGYTKTTMTEIADEIGMSAANLYRYFDNKQDIATACCLRIMTQRLDRLRAVATGEGSLHHRLKTYAMTLVEHTHELAAPDSRISELIDFVTSERTELVLEKLDVHYELIGGMLQDAQRAGEIECRDFSAAAKYIYSAFVVFDVPLFVGIYSMEEYKTRAMGIVDLIMAGLIAKQQPAG